MAFALDCRLIGFEVRGVEGPRTANSGNPFMTVRVESPQGRTAEISVNDSSLFDAVRPLRKGTVCNFDVAAVANSKRSFIMLLAAPVIVPADEVDY